MADEPLKAEIVKDKPLATVPVNHVAQRQGINLAGFVESMLHTVGTLDLTPEQEKNLYEKVSDNIVKIRPDGLIYVPWIEYSNRLHKVFGSKVGFILANPPQIKDNEVMLGLYLVAGGVLFGPAYGGQTYYPGSGMNYSDALESAKSNAKMRCCKELGMFPELWEPDFINTWKSKYAESYPGEGKYQGKTLWRLKTVKQEVSKEKKS